VVAVSLDLARPSVPYSIMKASYPTAAKEWRMAMANKLGENVILDALRARRSVGRVKPDPLPRARTATHVFTRTSHPAHRGLIVAG